jgi:hypothetical protein
MEQGDGAGRWSREMEQQEEEVAAGRKECKCLTYGMVLRTFGGVGCAD